MLIGLGLGFLVGAIYLVARVVHGLVGPDCAGLGLSPQECDLERQALSELARWQGLAAAALALLAAGIFLFVRSRRSSPSARGNEGLSERSCRPADQRGRGTS